MKSYMKIVSEIMFRWCLTYDAVYIQTNLALLSLLSNCKLFLFYIQETLICLGGNHKVKALQEIQSSNPEQKIQ